MTIRKFMGAALALAFFATAAAPASALGLYTPGFPALAAASVTGSETIPLDTNASSGAQTESITTTALKTYAQGGAIVTATGTSAASTANGERVVITTESLTTAAGAVFTETITDSSVAATSIAICSVALGSATTGSPAITTTTPGSGSLVVKVQNIHASAALNGTIVISCRISS